MLEEISLLEDGIRAIGEKALEFWRHGVSVKIKTSQYDIVTEADPILENDIKTLITDKFPKACIVGEERGGEMSNDYWVIDPIDGTNAFSAGLPTWSIVVARMENNSFTFSMIYVPLDIDGPQLYYAKKGKGAYMNDKKLKVSDKTDLKEANITLRATEIREDKDGIMRNLMRDTRMLWMPGSISLALAYLAAGKLDIVFAKNQPVWDRPGTLLVTEAGGKATITDSNVLATNGFLHDTVFSLIPQISA